MSLIETAQGEVVIKRFATRTEVIWDPDTNGGVVSFHMEKFTYLDEVLLSRISDGVIRGIMPVILERIFQIDDGQGGIIPVPGALVMATMKKAYEELYEEEQALLAQPAEEVPETSSEE